MHISGLGSYKFGSDKFEELLIVDCFGPERLDEYIGKGKLDVLLILVVHESLLSFVPGGRDNAVFIQKRAFETLASPEKDGYYYLHPSAIAACLYIDPTKTLALNDKTKEKLALEAQKDDEQVKSLYRRMRDAATWSAPTLVPETLQDQIQDVTSRLTGRRASAQPQESPDSSAGRQQRPSTRRSQRSSFIPKFMTGQLSENGLENDRDGSLSLDIELSGMFGAAAYEEAVPESALNPMLDQAMPLPAQGASREDIETKDDNVFFPQNTTVMSPSPSNLV